MPRKQVLIQFDDQLLAELDKERRRSRLSRSEAIRRAVRRWLREQEITELERQHEEGYRRIPEDDQDWTDALTRVAAENLPPYDA